MFAVITRADPIRGCECVYSRLPSNSRGRNLLTITVGGRVRGGGGQRIINILAAAEVEILRFPSEEWRVGVNVQRAVCAIAVGISHMDDDGVGIVRLQVGIADVPAHR